jgi:hypothetical protein
MDMFDTLEVSYYKENKEIFLECFNNKEYIFMLLDKVRYYEIKYID